MNSMHAGGCLCGATRYVVTGAPIRAQLCHCRFCQRRTGSSFSVVVAFKEDQVKMQGAALIDLSTDPTKVGVGCAMDSVVDAARTSCSPSRGI